MKESIKTCILLVSLLLMLNIPVNAQVNCGGQSLEGRFGTWDFRIKWVLDIGEDSNGEYYMLVAKLHNISTDDSYRCSGCSNGCATALVDWELWMPDGDEMFRHGQFKFKDVCNGQWSTQDEELRIFDWQGSPARLELRWNITTPNGRHSFEKCNNLWFRF